MDSDRYRFNNESLKAELTEEREGNAIVRVTLDLIESMDFGRAYHEYKPRAENSSFCNELDRYTPCIFRTPPPRSRAFVRYFSFPSLNKTPSVVAWITKTN